VTLNSCLTNYTRLAAARLLWADNIFSLAFRTHLYYNPLFSKNQALTSIIFKLTSFAAPIAVVKIPKPNHQLDKQTYDSIFFFHMVA
jgi:hypothetical protein